MSVGLTRSRGGQPDSGANGGQAMSNEQLRRPLQRLADVAKDASAAGRVFVHLDHAHPPVRSLLLPAPVRADGHAVDQLRGLDALELGPPFSLRVVRKPHLHRQPYGEGLDRNHAGTAQTSPGDAGTVGRRQATEPKRLLGAAGPLQRLDRLQGCLRVGVLAIAL